MSISVIASVTKSWSNRRRNAPLRRIPLSFLIVTSFGLIPNLAFSAWFSPELERFEDCTVEKTFLASTLKERSITSTLYVTRIQEDQESQTAKLFRERGLAGEIAYRPVYPSDTEIEDSRTMVLTSVVYRREASFLEKFFSGSETQVYFEVKMDGESFALNLSSFERPPFEVCI
jgi:hypothetical protein